MNQVANRETVADQPMPAFIFWGMTALLKIRDQVRPRAVLLDEIPLKAADSVLDYGCGPGSYVPGLAARVGPGGHVIAVDIHPLAVQQVRALAERRGLRNVKSLLCDGLHMPDLSDDSVNVVMLFDILHMLGDQAGVLSELHRVLRPDGILVVNDHHMDPDDLIADATRCGNFKFAKRGVHNFTFTPVFRGAA